MAIRLGDTAPNFTAQTTEGEVNLHEWLGDSWGTLFSHPADFTPVCTTELGAVAKIKSEFAKRNVKVIAVSVDPLDSHQKWIKRSSLGVASPSGQNARGSETQIDSDVAVLLLDSIGELASLYRLADGVPVQTGAEGAPSSPAPGSRP